jgi:glycosyltransferase involved in cell wall biosynthesis
VDSLNILHVVSLVAPRYAGTGIASQLMARYQAKIGHKVTICTTNVDFPKGTLRVSSEEPVFKDGVLIWHFPVQFRPLLVSIPLWLWLKSEIMSFDIIHIHGLYRFPVTAAAWKARKAGVPYLIMPHGSLDPFLYSQSQYNLPLKRIYERLFDIPNLNNSAAIHYTTKEEAKRVAFLRLRAKPVIVPNGIDWESFRLLPQKGSFRWRLGLDEKTPLVLFLGRINFKKGIDVLVPAFSQVIRKHPNARLAFVGPDNEGYGSKVKKWCKDKGIDDKVFFVDHLGPEEVKQAYVDADVFVLPSYTENFGLTVVESMACGCPVIISDRVNIWRQVEQVKAGIVVRLDPMAVAKAIIRLLEDRATAMAIGTRGRKAAEKLYGWPGIVERLISVYRGLIARRRPATNCR